MFLLKKKNLMSNLIKIQKEEWFVALIEELKAIMVEGIFDARQRVIETHWQLGKRLLEEYENFDRARIYGKDIVTTVSQSLSWSEKVVHQSIQFAKKFPNLKDIENLPEGKNLSWTKIRNQYLPEKSGTSHEHQWEKVLRCKICKAIKK